MRRLSPRLSVGYPQLTLAKFIVIAESLLKDFLRPLLIIGFFIALAWIGVFTGLYPWAHLVAFMVFFLSFFDSLGKAIASRKHISYSAARRRVEIASHLLHRPLDTFDDHPFAAEAETLALWQEHRKRLDKKLEHLRWPQWMLDMSGQDPYALRQALGILLVLGLVVGWGTLGGRLINAINPNLGNMVADHATLSAWITPPEHTGLPPIMIATPADVRHKNSVLTIPAGSVVTAHIAEREGMTPELAVNETSMTFGEAKDGGYGISETISKGTALKIRHGWKTLGEWNINVVADQPPRIEFTNPPKGTERHSTRIDFHAEDDFGLRTVMARIIPKDVEGGLVQKSADFPLSSTVNRDVSLVTYEDLTSSPWAGSVVHMTLIAEDGAGQKAVSSPATFVLPERSFSNPVAKALIDERKKLYKKPDDSVVRTEVANIMAGVAQQPALYGHDPVTLMCLRGGAVRLILGRDSDIGFIQDVLWQTAVRIEEGATGQSEKAMRQAQKELSDALGRDAPEAEIQRLINLLHQAMTQYLMDVQARMATAPSGLEALKDLVGQNMNQLTPDSLRLRIDHLRDMASRGARDMAQQELARLREMMENLKTGHAELSAEQRQQIEALHVLKNLESEQRHVLSSSYAALHGTKPDEALDRVQGHLRNTTLAHSEDLGKGITEELAHKMQQAQAQLQGQKWQGAVTRQEEILATLAALQASIKSKLQQALGAQQGKMSSGNQDPFGQELSGMPSQTDGQTIVPSTTKTERIQNILNDLRSRAGDNARSPTERDYIERLLEHY